MAIIVSLIFLSLLSRPTLGLVTRKLYTRDDDLSIAVQAIRAELSSPTFVPYSQPSQKVEEFIALGDSYTAGIGSNGNAEVLDTWSERAQRAYPMLMAADSASWATINDGDDTLPRFSFHAYSGDLSRDMVENQLQQGPFVDNKNAPRNQRFGKPQLAVVTIGGNDAKLSK